jgi:hypothetical protein
MLCTPTMDIQGSGPDSTTSPGLSDYPKQPMPTWQLDQMQQTKEAELTRMDVSPAIAHRSSATRPSNVPALRLSAIPLIASDTDSDRLATDDSVQGRFASLQSRSPENLVPRRAAGSQDRDRKRDDKKKDGRNALVDATIGWLVTEPTSTAVSSTGSVSPSGHSSVSSGAAGASSSPGAGSAAKHTSGALAWDVEEEPSRPTYAQGVLDETSILRFQNQEERSTITVNDVSDVNAVRHCALPPNSSRTVESCGLI